MFRNIFLLIMICLLFSTHVVFGAWEQLGDYLNTNVDHAARFTSVDCAPDGTPYIAFYETTSRYATDDKVYVKKWNGTDWEQIGSVFGQHSYPDIKVVSQNKIYLACAGANVDQDLTAYLWNGSSWANIGSSFRVNATADMYPPKLAVDSTEMPYMTWYESDITPITVYVKKWNGTDWSLVGNHVNDDGESGIEPFIEVYEDVPYVAYKQGFGTAPVYLKFFNGTTWERKINSAVYAADSYTMGVSEDGTFYIVRSSGPNNYWPQVVSVFYSDNGAWTQLGDSLNLVESIPQMNYCTVSGIAFFENTPLVSVEHYYGQDVFIKYWNGFSWEMLDTKLSDNSRITDASGISQSGGVVYVGWDERDGSSWDAKQVYIAKEVFVPPTPTPTSTPTSTITPTITQTTTSTPIATATPTALPCFSNGGYAVPNPYVPHNGKLVEFVFGMDNPMMPYSVSIMNLKGKIVKKLENKRIWDGRSDAGHLCEGGVYIYQIEAEGKRVTGKVVLIK
ncbi:hypothetical protein K8S19_09260 [bacterium]|nr:hypothetical protein [bacterium]